MTMLSLDYPSNPSKHDIEYYVPEQCQLSYDSTANNSVQAPCWVTNELNSAIPIWTSVTDQGLFPFLSNDQQNHSHFDPSSSIGTISDISSGAQSPCYITSSPSTSTYSSIPSPTNYINSHSAPAPTTITPLGSLQQWTREALIDRVMALEHELEYCRSSESPKQDGWQCRWGTCDTVTSTLEQLTDHLYRIHVGRGKASYYCGWTGCARHDKPFTKRHKMHNHLRVHTGERPFVCRTPGCHKRFSRPDSLSTHQKTHSNVRPFICMECGKSYFHARSLRKHLKASQHATLTGSC